MNSGLAISSVVAHGGETVTIDETATPPEVYDLGDFEVGEEIKDVVITTTGSSNLSYTMDTSSTKEVETVSNYVTFSSLPTGLSFTSSATTGECKIEGTVEVPADNTEIGRTK